MSGCESDAVARSGRMFLATTEKRQPETSDRGASGHGPRPQQKEWT
ncbi:hypothetical protein AB0912_12450 [Streptomyces sp. NPDC007084]